MIVLLQEENEKLDSEHKAEYIAKKENLLIKLEGRDPLEEMRICITSCLRHTLPMQILFAHSV